MVEEDRASCRHDANRMMMYTLKRIVKKGVALLVGVDRAKYLYCRVRRMWRYRTVLPPRAVFVSHVPHTLSLAEQHTFFGYHDLSPFDEGGNIVLALAAQHVAVPGKDMVRVGYFNLQTDTFCDIEKTSTWNWQAGCRLQWCLGDRNELVAYNTLVDGTCATVLYDIQSGCCVRTLPGHIYSFSYDGAFGFSINFVRLSRMHPGYGYVGLPDHTNRNAAPEDDGVWLVNVETKQKELVVSLRLLSEFKSDVSMMAAEHHVNLVCPSPSSQKIAFLHQWMSHKKKHTRAIVYDLKDSSLLALVSEGNVSHMTWRSNDEILTTEIGAGGQVGYYLHDIRTSTRRPFLEHVLCIDGHPSYGPNGVVLTDTVPDMLGERRLLLIGKDKQVSELARFYDPQMGVKRCDLHPRWDKTGERICFDSVHTGVRSINILDI